MNDNIYANLILDYINRGFSPIPVPFKAKNPIMKAWPKLIVTANDYETYFDREPINIGILTGKPSGELVDVDIDNLAALKFTPWFLPKTNCIFGHESKPKSHWVYRVPKAKASERFIAERMILEIRGNNRCTVFPGSFHPSGEPIEFENPDDYEPSSSTWKQLKRAGSNIAMATELYKKWSPGTRHELTLYTAAMLARLNWHEAEVRNLITAIAHDANDDELEDRLIAVQTTFAEFNQGRPISGDERLSQILGAETAHNIRKWACSPEALKPHAMPVAPATSIQNPIGTASADLSNDSGAADAFAAKFKNDLIYCNEEWFQRKNQVFEPVGSEIVQGLAKDFLVSVASSLHSAAGATCSHSGSDHCRAGGSTSCFPVSSAIRSARRPCSDVVGRSTSVGQETNRLTTGRRLSNSRWQSGHEAIWASAAATSLAASA
jgi:hypothetical protein